MIYTFICDYKSEFSIGKMCQVLEVSASSYYHWMRSPKDNQKQAKEDLKQTISDVYFEFRQRYGSLRLTAELKVRGIKISEPNVAKYIKELGLKSKLAKEFRITTDNTILVAFKMAKKNSTFNKELICYLF
ncbi:IS3 family transposase [Myroides sp. LJL116]